MNSKQFLIGAEKSFPYRILSGEGLDRVITDPCAHVYDGTEGFWRSIKSGQIVIITPESIDTLPSDINSATSCLFLSGCDSCPSELFHLLAEKNIPLVISNLEKDFLASRVTGLLREKLESKVYLHGSMVVFKGIGVLVTGESGSGKSRCCLDLLVLGAKLVSDDLVEIEKERGVLYARSPEQIRNMIEVRGAGLTDVRTLFGENALEQRARVDIAFEISSETSVFGSRRDKSHPDCCLDILGIDIPLKVINAGSGKSVSQIVKEACEERCRDNYR